MIIAVLSGIILNLLGGPTFLYNTAVLGGLVGTLQFLSALTIPLILMIVGYGIRFDRAAVREAGLVIGLRLALLIPLALILNAVVIRGL